MKTVINIIIESGKRRKTEVSCYHYGMDKIVYFNDGGNATKGELAEGIAKMIRSKLAEPPTERE